MGLRVIILTTTQKSCSTGFVRPWHKTKILPSRTKHPPILDPKRPQHRSFDRGAPRGHERTVDTSGTYTALHQTVTTYDPDIHAPESMHMISQWYDALAGCLSPSSWDPSPSIEWHRSCTVLLAPRYPRPSQVFERPWSVHVPEGEPW